MTVTGAAFADGGRDLVVGRGSERPGRCQVGRHDHAPVRLFKTLTAAGEFAPLRRRPVGSPRCVAGRAVGLLDQIPTALHGRAAGCRVRYGDDGIRRWRSEAGRQLIGCHRMIHRWQRAQVGDEIAHVLAGHAVEGDGGHRPEKELAATNDGLQRGVAEARRDLGDILGRHEPPWAREGLAARHDRLGRQIHAVRAARAVAVLTGEDCRQIPATRRVARTVTVHAGRAPDAVARYQPELHQHEPQSGKTESDQQDADAGMC